MMTATTLLAALSIAQAASIVWLFLRDENRAEAWRRSQNAAIEYALRMNVWSARKFLRLFVDGEVHAIEREYPDFSEFRRTYEAQEGF